jgi:UDP-glucose 4-epimerase
MGEQILQREASLGKMKVVSLRYFNVAGAGSPLLADNSVSNLIPMVFERLKKGMQPQIFGTDYDTPDGTCIRDFIHVVDLASAHLAALNFLETSTNDYSIFNVGTGIGYSVKEVIEVIRQVTKVNSEAEILPRREGDPARVVADISLARRELNWDSKLSLEDMVRSSWDAIM